VSDAQLSCELYASEAGRIIPVLSDDGAQAYACPVIHLIDLETWLQYRETRRGHPCQDLFTKEVLASRAKDIWEPFTVSCWWQGWGFLLHGTLPALIASS
jgi:hypothetical protein